MTDNILISHAPASGEEIWRGSYGDVEAAVSAARRAWAPWAARPLTDRIAVLRTFSNLVRREGEEFAELIAREMGKPLWEARTEVDAVVNKIDIAVQAYAERTGKKKLDAGLNASAALRHKPHGVMAVISPYNFPAHIPNGHIVPALIAGNAVVFKPSEKTPAVGEALVSAFHRAGVPEDVIQLLVGGPEEGKALVAHPGIDGVLFTGSAQVGIAINRKLAANPGKIVALEMGGNNPIVVTDTPRLADAAALIAQSAFTTAGQRCTAARRLIVLDSIYDALMAELVPLTR
ncbi:MAG: N-succinylglutamate 5-semialdehyde dehydrogenase, partial [Burkholderiales bacterium PBB5]